MSPEQLQALPADPRSDVFSLGVVLYEMATGRRPFEGQNAAAVIASILRDLPVPPTRLNDAFPPRLDRIISRCLEKDPRYRLPAAHDLLWELEQLEGEVGAERRLGRSIAVLPFTDHPREQDQDYFCEGIAEEIITGLTQLHGLRVVSRTSSFAFKDKPTIWTHETLSYLVCASILLTMAYTLKYKQHVAVDLIYARLKPKTKALLDVITFILFLGFFSVVFLWKGTVFAATSWVMLERTPSAFNFYVFPAKTLLPVGVFLLFIQGLSDFTKNIVFLVKGEQL